MRGSRNAEDSFSSLEPEEDQAEVSEELSRLLQHVNTLILRQLKHGIQECLNVRQGCSD